MKKIVVFTGKRISSESGLGIFRDSNRLWENHRIEDVAISEEFQNKVLLYKKDPN